MYEEIQDHYPLEFALRDQDKYRYRYPKGEVSGCPTDFWNVLLGPDQTDVCSDPLISANEADSAERPRIINKGFTWLSLPAKHPGLKQSAVPVLFWLSRG